MAFYFCLARTKRSSAVAHSYIWSIEAHHNRTKALIYDTSYHEYRKSKD